jgi:hypothetical protein
MGWRVKIYTIYYITNSQNENKYYMHAAAQLLLLLLPSLPHTYTYTRAVLRLFIYTERCLSSLRGKKSNNYTHEKIYIIYLIEDLCSALPFEAITA